MANGTWPQTVLCTVVYARVWSEKNKPLASPKFPEPPEGLTEQEQAVWLAARLEEEREAVLRSGGTPELASQQHLCLDVPGTGSRQIGINCKVFGVFCVDRYLSAHPCFQVPGLEGFITPSSFEHLGGGTGARWYRSIYVIPGRTTLEKWLVSHGLEVRRGGSRSRRIQPNDLPGTSLQYGSDDGTPSRDKPYGKPQRDGDDDKEGEVEAGTQETSQGNSAGGGPHKRLRLALEPSPLEQLSAVAAAAAIGLIPAAAPFGNGGGSSDSSAAPSSHRLLCSSGAAAVPLLPLPLPEPLLHSGASTRITSVQAAPGDQLGTAPLGQPAAAATDVAQADENARTLSRALQLLGQYHLGSHFDNQEQQEKQQQQQQQQLLPPLLQQSGPASGCPLSSSPTRGSPTHKAHDTNVPAPGNASSSPPIGASAGSTATVPAAGMLPGATVTSTVGRTLGPPAGTSSSAHGPGCKPDASAPVRRLLVEAARTATTVFSGSPHSAGGLATRLASYPASPETPAVVNGPSVEGFSRPAASSRVLFLHPPFGSRHVQQPQDRLLQSRRGAEGQQQQQQQQQQCGKESHDKERSQRPSSTSTTEDHQPCSSDRSPSRTPSLAHSSGLRTSPHGAPPSWLPGSPLAGSPRHPEPLRLQQPAAGTTARTTSDAADMPQSPLHPHAGWQHSSDVRMWPDRRTTSRMQHSSSSGGGGGGGPPPGVVLLPRPLPRLAAVLPAPCMGGPRPVHDARYAALQSGSPMAASAGSPRTPVTFVPRPLIAPYGLSPAPGIVRVSPDARLASSSEARSSPSGRVLGKRAWAAVGQTQVFQEQAGRAWEHAPPAVQAMITSGQGRPMGLVRPVAPAGRVVAYDRHLVESGWGTDHPQAESPRFFAGEGAGVGRQGHVGSPSCSGEVHHLASGQQLRGRQVREEEEEEEEEEEQQPQQWQQQGWSHEQQRQPGQGGEQTCRQQREVCGLARGSGSPAVPSWAAPRAHCRPVVFVPPFPPPGTVARRPLPHVTYAWPGPRPGSAPAAAAAAGAAAPFAAGGGRGVQRPVYVIPMPYAPHVAAPQGAAVFVRSRPAPPGPHRMVHPSDDGAEPFADEREYSEGQHEQSER